MLVSCKQAVLCAEDAVQVRRRTYARRYYGPASDAEFLRSIADRTPGRDDDEDNAHRHQNQMRRRQVYLKSYVFVTKEEAETKATRGGRRALVDAVCRDLPSVLLRRRRTRPGGHDDDHGSSGGRKRTTSSSSSWCAKKASKVLSQLLTRLRSCTSNPAAAAAASSSSSSSSHAGAAGVHRSSIRRPS